MDRIKKIKGFPEVYDLLSYCLSICYEILRPHQPLGAVLDIGFVFTGPRADFARAAPEEAFWGYSTLETPPPREQQDRSHASPVSDRIPL
jgi:hypothetical protein